MKRNDTFLVVGADGLIGRALADNLARKVVLETTHLLNTISDHRVFLDMTQDVSKWQPPKLVSVAFICAAISSLERCRTQPELSALFNVHNTVAVAKTLVANGAFVIFLSSNQVYDGSIPFRKAEEEVCPITEYGQLKAETERQLLALGDSVSVVRFTKILEPESALISAWAKSLKNGKIIHPFSDMCMAPIPLSCAILVLQLVADARLPGILQVSGTNDISYAEAAYLGAEVLDEDLSLIKPVKASESRNYLEAVPTYTTLNIDRLRSVFGIEPPNVEWTVKMTFKMASESAGLV